MYSGLASCRLSPLKFWRRANLFTYLYLYLLSISINYFITITMDIWIVGSSIVHWLERHLTATRSARFTRTLGLDCQVHWMGRRGMRWEQLVPLLRRTSGPAPAVMVIHLGGNNLGSQSGCSLLRSIRRDLDCIHWMFPDTMVLFSDIIQRRVYRSQARGRSAYGIERSRRFVNAGVAGFMRRVGVANSNIRHDQDVFRRDGVHLNRRGNELFLENVLGPHL